jgi:hypothetical protein
VSAPSFLHEGPPQPLDLVEEARPGRGPLAITDVVVIDLVPFTDAPQRIADDLLALAVRRLGERMPVVTPDLVAAAYPPHCTKLIPEITPATGLDDLCVDGEDAWQERQATAARAVDADRYAQIAVTLGSDSTVTQVAVMIRRTRGDHRRTGIRCPSPFGNYVSPALAGISPDLPVEERIAASFEACLDAWYATW